METQIHRELDKAFELIKSNFDSGKINDDTFLQCLEIYTQITKAREINPIEAVTYSKEELAAFARKVPAKRLKLIILKSSDERLRVAATNELERRRKEGNYVQIN